VAIVGAAASPVYKDCAGVISPGRQVFLWNKTSNRTGRDIDGRTRAAVKWKAIPTDFSLVNEVSKR